MKKNLESKITTPSTSPRQRLSTTENASSEMCSALYHLAIAGDIAIPSFAVYFLIMFILSKEVITDGCLRRAECSIFTRLGNRLFIIVDIDSSCHLAIVSNAIRISFIRDTSFREFTSNPSLRYTLFREIREGDKYKRGQIGLVRMCGWQGCKRRIMDRHQLSVDSVTLVLIILQTLRFLHF